MYDIVEEGETHAQMPIVRHRGWHKSRTNVF
jgi:hypothetical protein